MRPELTLPSRPADYREVSSAPIDEGHVSQIAQRCFSCTLLPSSAGARKLLWICFPTSAAWRYSLLNVKT
jgi:hypothetical protein